MLIAIVATSILFGGVVGFSWGAAFALLKG
jgi:hypothetical protein